MEFLKRFVVVAVVLGLFSVFLINTGKWEGAVVEPVRALFGGEAAENVDEFGRISSETVERAPGAFDEMFPDGFGGVDPEAASEAVEATPTTTDARIPDYRRDEFGSAWADVDKNGCDTRNDILARDLTGTTLKSGSSCVILTGTLDDPYTGKTINFVRGEKTSIAVAIDHIFSLSDAWSAGAWSWSDERRAAFANDPDNLIAVDGPTNSSKGARTPADWTPPNEAFECLYVTKYVYITVKYGLTLAADDKDAIYNVLGGCAL